MARFLSLFSSSSGNCTYFEDAHGAILIDAGVSAKRIKQSLLNHAVDLSRLKAIFVTHEHSDHIKGVRVLASALKIPVYATEGTLEGMAQAGQLCDKFPYRVMPREGVEAGGLWVSSFKTPHDSNESCGYRVLFSDERTAAVATDIGCVNDEVMNNLLGCDLVMLESNHDVGMLENGDYPYYLKRRILSNVGHLSNEDCAKAASTLVEHGTTRLFLGHLSRENNLPELAYEQSVSQITQSTGARLSGDFLLEVNPVENLRDIVRF